MWKYLKCKDKEGKELVDVCINIQFKLMFEKEILILICYLFLKGIMIFYIVKFDKVISIFSSFW